MVIEKTDTGFSAFSPDVPGCITVGKTVESTIVNMREAIELYMENCNRRRAGFTCFKKYRTAYSKWIIKRWRNSG